MSNYVHISHQGSILATPERMGGDALASTWAIVNAPDRETAIALWEAYKTSEKTS